MDELAKKITEMYISERLDKDPINSIISLVDKFNIKGDIKGDIKSDNNGIFTAIIHTAIIHTKTNNIDL